MPLWAQTIFVLALVIGCAAMICRQFVASLSGKRSRAGSCCAKGCVEQGKSQAAAEAPKRAGKRIVFMPVEMLAKRKQSRP